jgi:hypothetical protein
MKRIKLYEEFLAAEPKREIAPSKPSPEIHPGKPGEKPSRPSPIPIKHPGVEPTPKAEIPEASEQDVINRFADELDSLSEEDKEDYARILKKYNKK